MTSSWTIPQFLLCFTVLGFASGGGYAGAAGTYEYEPPRPAEDGWKVGRLDEVNVDPVKITALMEEIGQGKFRAIHSILLVRRGKLVLEQYYPGVDFMKLHKKRSELEPGDIIQYGLETPQYIASVTKSVVSMLTGIAIGEGKISGIETPVFVFFPDYASLAVGEKTGITLRHLLMMSSGLEWEESTLNYGRNKDDLSTLFQRSDPVQFILEKPMVFTPGSRFDYNGGNTNLIARIIERATGSTLDAYAEEKLFGPLGIAPHVWRRLIASGQIYASGDLQLRPRDMAKLGQLYLQKGNWDGRQIVPESWVAASTSVAIDNGEGGYGYQWWLGSYETNGKTVATFRADGWGGQYIIVAPELELVMVMTGGNYTTGTALRPMLERFVLPACLAEGPSDRQGT